MSNSASFPFPPAFNPSGISRASFLRGTLAGSALLAAGALAGCASTPKSGSPVQEFRYNLGGPVATFWPMFVANDLGLLRENGIESPLVIDPTNGMQQLLSGDIQGYGQSTDIMAAAANKGAPLIGIAGLPATPYDLIVSEKISSFKDLRGQKVGVALIQGASGAIMRKLLRTAGLQDDEYELVLTGAAASKIASLETGAIAAAMFMAPQSTDIVARNTKVRKLADTTDAISAPMITSWVNSQWASKNRDLLVAWLSAQHKATQWLSDSQNREEAAKILSNFTKVDVKTCESTYDQLASKRLFNSGLTVDFPALDDFLTLVAETGVGPFKPAKEYFDMSYADAALAK